MPNSTLPPGRLLEKLAEARHRGHWLEAIQHFTITLESVLKSQGEPDLLRCQMGPNFAELLMPSLHRSSNQCPFIEAYRNSGRDLISMSERLVGSVEQVFFGGRIRAATDSLLDQLQTAAARTVVMAEDRLLRGLELRLATILSLNAYASSPSNCRDQFKSLIKAYQKFWQTEVWKQARPAGKQVPSVGWFRLHHTDSALADHIQAVITETKYSFLDPAVAFLVDTLCELRGVSNSERAFSTELEDGSQWHRGDTYGLVVLENVLGIGVRGIVWRLRIERVQCSDSEAAVSGSFHPHPHTAAHMQINDDFQEAIRNAWLAVCGPIVHSHDYRWSIIPVDYSCGDPDWFDGPVDFCKRHSQDWPNRVPHPLRHQFLYIPLSGPSATLAFALALKSVQPNAECPVRRDLVASAAFKLTHNQAGIADCKDLMTDTAILEPVGHIPKKTDIPELELLKISNLVVADNQEVAQPLNPPFDSPIEVSSFDAAWKTFSIHEAQIAEFSRSVSARWDDEVRSIKLADFEDKQNDTDRLDRFVMPELSWEIVHEHPAEGQERYKLENVDGENLQQFHYIWKRLEREQPKTKHLFLYDTAGAGKSVVSIRFREQLSNLEQAQKFFNDGLPRLVFRWIKALPVSPGDKLIDKICADPDWSSTVKQADREAILRFALEQQRVVIIVDGLDEFSFADQSMMMRMLHPKAANRDLDALKCQWVFTGRQHVIDEWFQNAEVFSDSNSLRLRIRDFSVAKQNEYFDDLTAKGIDWRASLVDIADEERAELLGLPMNLRAIRRLIEDAIEHKSPIPKFVSHSDLFLQTARPLLKLALAKRTVEQKDEDRKTGLKPAPLLELLENVLGLVAFQMALDHQWRSIQPRGNKSLSQTIETVLDAAKNRANGNAKRHWDWAINVLHTIVFNNRATTEAFGGDYLAFQNKRVQEMHVARYLTTSSTDKDLQGTADLMCALGHNGDPAWENIWIAVIKMPTDKVNADRYRQVVKVLFERPIQTDQRRPTKLMWQANQWIKSQSRSADSPLVGFDLELREYLGEQFRKCLESEDERRREVAQSLIEANNYVILADKTNPEYTAEEIMKYVPDFETGRFKMGRDAVEVTLSAFGICKYPVSNEQFQLFDDNFAFEQDERSRFGGKLQPCVYASWFDSYWFSDFVGWGAAVTVGDCKWRVTMPTEAQFEYAYRAGCQGTYFYARQDEGIIEVDNASLHKYAHIGLAWDSRVTALVTEKEPNAWNLRLAGNVWKWVYDYYGSLKGGQNPVATSGSARVIRGGSWGPVAAGYGSSDRYWLDPSLRWNDDGVVLALSPSGSPSQSSKEQQ